MILLALAGCLCVTDGGSDLTERERRIVARMSPVPALPDDTSNRVADHPTAIELGAMCFKLPVFSSSGTVSCATCHKVDRGFTDGLPVAKGEGVGTRNTPQLTGVAHQRWFFWDGRADSLWAQALHPFEHEAEFNSSRGDVVKTLAAMPELRSRYETLFGPMPDLDGVPDGAKPGTDAWASMSDADRDAVTGAFVNIGKSIAAFERTLQPGTSPFDRFATALAEGRSTDGILSPPAIRGLQLFMGEAGCRNCHAGPLMTDRAFHSLGLPPKDGLLPADLGRAGGLAKARASAFRLNGKWSDDPTSPAARRAANAVDAPGNWGAMRTPSLRNVSITGPYMHDGRFETIAQVLDFYNTLEGQVQFDHHQETILKPLNLPPEDLQALEAFLKSLEDGAPDAASGEKAT
ncbi:MAG: hypothetical protein MK101_08625 [Phycisphaerales bacterium]|nr:hypothetical protein [Phycisphaerales bacterium]